ncbi:hypothetical protein HY251_18980 [bacterium]|nr:hypothetical protein [bacterium]
MRRAPPGVAVLLFFLAFYGLASSGWVFRVPDELEVYFQTESLWERGSLAVPQALAPRGSGRSVFFGKLGGPEGKTPYAPYGPLPAFLALPFHAAARGVASVAGVDRETAPDSWRVLVSGLTALASAAAGALAVLGFFRAARALGASENRALVLSCVLGGATVLLPYSKSFFSEAFSAAFFVWAAALLLEARRERSARLLALAALLVFLAGITKATNLVFAVAFALAPLADRKLDARTRGRAAFALGLAVIFAALVHAQWNVHRFGDASDFGYDFRETIPGAEARPFGASLARGLLVLLVSPGKSIVLWAPALALLALPRARELGQDRALGSGLALGLGLGLLVFGKYFFPEGGYCHGPRHLVPIVPLLLLPAALGEKPTRGALALALGLGLALNSFAASVSYLEDQAWGEDRTRSEYYESVDTREDPGLPENRYRLDYSPEVSLPKIALRSVSRIVRGESEAPGTGLDFFPLHLARVRSSERPDAAAIPRFLGPSLVLGWIGLLAFAAWSLGGALLREENAAILGPGKTP